jgi:hypothetical protein
MARDRLAAHKQDGRNRSSDRAGGLECHQVSLREIKVEVCLSRHHDQFETPSRFDAVGEENRS